MEGGFDKKLFFCCLFGGFFGLHKFVNGQIIMGFVYLFTEGLWGIGIVFDLIRIITNTYDMPLDEFIDTMKKYQKGEKINTVDILLEPNERCIFSSKGFIYDDKETENAINMSLDNMDFSGPISYGAPSRRKKKAKKTRNKLVGKFYFTNKRIMFISNKDKIIEEKLENINEIKNMGSYVNIFVGKIEHKIYMGYAYKFYELYVENEKY